MFVLLIRNVYVSLSHIHTHTYPQESSKDIKQKLAFITLIIKDRNTITPIQLFNGRFK